MMFMMHDEVPVGNPFENFQQEEEGGQ